MAQKEAILPSIIHWSLPKEEPVVWQMAEQEAQAARQEVPAQQYMQEAAVPQARLQEEEEEAEQAVQVQESTHPVQQAEERNPNSEEKVGSAS